MSTTRSREPLIVGVDVGTTVTKAVIFDGDGRALRRAARPTHLRRVGDGRYEQDTDQMVRSAFDVIAELASSVDGVVAAVGVTGQGDGLWLVDAAGYPVRPGISWLDGRAGDIVSRWETTGLLEMVFRRTGNHLFPGSAGPLLAWLDAHEPDSLKRATTAAYCKDVVVQRLTGIRATDPSDASAPFLDPGRRTYDEDLIAACALAHHAHLLAPVTRPPIGGLTTAAAAATRLPLGTPVVAAPYDLPASAWGAGVDQVGDGLLIVGTTLACQVLTDRVDTGGEPCGLTLSTWDNDRWLRALPAMVGTAALDWMLTLVGAGLDELPDMLATGRADGLTVLPFFSESGERAPFVAPGARARIDGVHLGTSRADLVRAVCEAVAYSGRHCLSAAGLTGDLAACGGGVASPAWAQIFADVMDRPIRVLAGEEVGARGAALAAMTALGQSGPVPGGRLTGTVCLPDPHLRDHYDSGYARYLDQVAQAKPSWAATAKGVPRDADPHRGRR